MNGTGPLTRKEWFHLSCIALKLCLSSFLLAIAKFVIETKTDIMDFNELWIITLRMHLLFSFWNDVENTIKILILLITGHNYITFYTYIHTYIQTYIYIYHHHHYHRLYSPGWALASAWGFVTIFFFCRVRLLASCPNPNLEGQGIPFRLGHHPWPVYYY